MCCKETNKSFPLGYGRGCPHDVSVDCVSIHTLQTFFFGHRSSNGEDLPFSAFADEMNGHIFHLRYLA